MNVLIIDDLAADRELISRILRKSASVEKVEAVSDCKEALNTMDGQFQCIVIDQRLIGMQGDDCIHEIRERLYVGVLILVTGYSDDETLSMRAIQKGADDFVCKDVMDTKLIPAIEAALERRAAGMKVHADVKEKIEEINHIGEHLEDIEKKIGNDES
jgi:CheY-like chemotaxis protein